MAQIKVYGVEEKLIPIRDKLSTIIHECVMEALGLPEDKRAHRFIPIAKDNFYMPAGRSDAYTILEISMIQGRTTETKKKLIRLLFDRIKTEVGIDYIDLECCIYESPPGNWGFRGMHGDEIVLNYEVNV